MRTTARSCHLHGILLLAFAASIGCKPSYQLDTAKVSGRVTLDGEPVTSGYVMVTPTKGRMARGTIQPDGTFVLGTYSGADGVQLGTHPVTVSPVPPDESSGRSRPTQQIPERYRKARASGLTLNVDASGVDDYLIELTSAP